MCDEEAVSKKEPSRLKWEGSWHSTEVVVDGQKIDATLMGPDDEKESLKLATKYLPKLDDLAKNWSSTLAGALPELRKRLNAADAKRLDKAKLIPYSLSIVIDEDDEAGGTYFEFGIDLKACGVMKQELSVLITGDLKGAWQHVEITSLD